MSEITYLEMLKKIHEFHFDRVYADKNDIECHQKYVGEKNCHIKNTDESGPS